MNKNKIQLAKDLGLNIKVKSDTPGVYLKTSNGKRQLNIEEVFPELVDLKDANDNKKHRE